MHNFHSSPAPHLNMGEICKDIAACGLHLIGADFLICRGYKCFKSFVSYGFAKTENMHAHAFHLPSLYCCIFHRNTEDFRKIVDHQSSVMSVLSLRLILILLQGRVKNSVAQSNPYRDGIKDNKM